MALRLSLLKALAKTAGKIGEPDGLTLPKALTETAVTIVVENGTLPKTLTETAAKVGGSTGLTLF